MPDAASPSLAPPSIRPPRLFYGWIIVLACNLVACITWGVGIFNQGVFIAYYVTAYGWSPAALAVGPVVFHLWAGFAGVIVGRIVDRRGPRPVLLAGAASLAIATIGFASVRELWQVYPVFLLAGTGFACIHTVTLGKIVARWFVRQRSRAMAAATFGAGLGGALLVPLNVLIIERYGLFAGGVALAAITVLAILPLVVWVIKDGPEVLGLAPDGDPRQAAAANASTAAMEADAVDTRIWSLKDAIRTVPFWGLSLCFALGMVAQSAYLFHQVTYLQATLGMVGAASIVSVTTIFGIVGRLIFIGGGDRLSPRGWTVAVFATQCLSFLLLSISDTPVGLAIGSALFGLTMGVAVTLQPLATAYIFGRESFGRVYGPIYMAIRIGSACGPLAVGLILGATASYGSAWLLLAASLGLAALVVPLAIRPVSRPFSARQ